MNENFILLTTSDNNPIIIGISSIASIHISSTNPKLTVVTLNFAVGPSYSNMKISVIETFAQMKSILGL